MKTIILDSGPVGMIVNSNAKSSLTLDCQAWFSQLSNNGYLIVLPEIVDYEVRRELILQNKSRSLQQLDILKHGLYYLTLTTEAILLAAQLWAEVRRSGQSTADPKALDGDVILAAQVLNQFSPAFEPIVATTNVAHIKRFTPAQLWESID